MRILATWIREYKETVTFPRFAIEEDLWMKFKSHCLGKGISVQGGIRTLVVRYLKYNKLIDDSVTEDYDAEYIQIKKNYRKATHEKYGRFSGDKPASI